MQESAEQVDLYPQKFHLLHNDKIILTGNEYEVSEKVEELLEEGLGIFIHLRPDTTEKEYRIYMHPSNEEDISDRRLEELNDDYGINLWDEYATDYAIKELLKLKIREV